MKKNFTILIADRNRHVREFLKREMEAEGYRIRLAKNCQEILKWVWHHEPLDMLILDLNLPDESELGKLEKLQDRIPTLPVVIHSFFSDYADHPAVLTATAFIEKGGSSIENLKKVVYEVFQQHSNRSKDGVLKPILNR